MFASFAGKSTSGINEEIIWISISMAIAIAVLIAIALCYILKEKCSKRKAYREQSWRYKEEFAKHALADSLTEIDFPSYTLYPQYSPDGKEYYYNFHRFTYLRNSFKLPPKDYPKDLCKDFPNGFATDFPLENDYLEEEYPIKIKQEVYISA